MRRRAAALLSVAMAAGCSDDAPVQTSPPDPEPKVAGCPEGRTCDFAMDLGVGLYEFEQVAPDDEIVVTLGPQGGFHVWLATRCTDCSDQVLIEYGVRGSADGAWLVGKPLRGIVNLETDAEGRHVATGLYGLLPGTPDTIDYVGFELLLEATITDDERSSSRVIPVVAGSVEEWDCPEVDPETCAPD
jgi:hypothetical protein